MQERSALICEHLCAWLIQSTDFFRFDEMMGFRAVEGSRTESSVRQVGIAGVRD